MFKKMFLVVSFIFTPIVFADGTGLSEVKLNISAEQWVMTQTAKVIVDINASVDQSGLDAIRKQMQAKLQKIVASDDWHITRFDRSQNQSGLEQINAQAEARIPNEKLTGVRNQAKSISKAGETFTISSIEFTPSLSDVELVRSHLRQEIYSKVNNELMALNKAYPEQHYRVETIDFSSSTEAPGNPSPMAARMNMMKAVNMNSNNLSVSNQLKLEAFVILAAENNKTTAVLKNN